MSAGGETKPAVLVVDDTEANIVADHDEVVVAMDGKSALERLLVRAMADLFQNDGDIVAVAHSVKDPKVLDGEMVAFQTNGGMTIKWLKFDSDHETVVRVPENTEDPRADENSARWRLPSGPLQLRGLMRAPMRSAISTFHDEALP